VCAHVCMCVCVQLCAHSLNFHAYVADICAHVRACVPVGVARVNTQENCAIDAMLQ